MKMDYRTYTSVMQEIADIHAAMAILHWDKEVYMPKGSSAFRSRQLATLAGLAHEKFTDDNVGAMLEALHQMHLPDQNERRNIELSLKDYRKATKLSRVFVQKLTHASSEAFQSWIEARKKNAYEHFRPALEQLVDLKREEASLRGFETSPYDTLLDLYEPDLKSEQLDHMFEEVNKGVTALLKEIRERPQAANILQGYDYDRDKQWAFCEELLKNMGYDSRYGRQDLSEHPFTISFSPRDVRITTRMSDRDIGFMIWSSIHELGHAFYEQGLPPKQYGLPLGQAASLSIHESQSRLWENHVGRSDAFCTFLLHGLRKVFPTRFHHMTSKHLYQAINRITPSLIRTESDELHYHLHVYIRYRIEKELIEGNLEVRDVKDVWNAMYEKYLGLEVPDDRQGVLQDVHWSHGSFGYFPTYSLGSFYAAQIYQTAERSIPGLDEEIASGRFASLLEWLRTRIHQYGRLHDPEDLCIKCTGEPLNVHYFLEYARKKYRALHQD